MMKALTIYQPWASLIMVGAKPHEFRGWDYSERFPSLVGTRIAIHAAARPIKLPEIVDLLNRLRDGTTGLVAEVARPLLLRILDARKGAGVVELSAVLGTAVIGKPIKATDMVAGTVLQDSDRVDHSLFGWPLTEIQPFLSGPVPCNGAQGFWNYQGEAI